MSNGKRVLTGTYFEMGNWACAQGVIAAGCEFVAGYPITPASEIINRLAQRLPQVGGTFLQTEDEISAICSAPHGQDARHSSLPPARVSA